ncbi:MAG: flavin reductase family protein [Clostridia bacterium]|nr:flavin reductase family protein [Clostridia bacterium]MBR6754598.1 flavin reductase family protein [Clostridia bacterium]
MAKIKWKGGALLSPLPAVLVSCGNGEIDNVFTVAWTGIVCTKPPMLSISVRKERFSYDLIDKSGEFCVNLTPESLVRAVDYCGVRSGRDTDKFKEMKLTKTESFELSCPSIAECPITLECKVNRKIELGSHDMFIADIVAVGADEELIDEKGRLMLEKARLLSYSHGDYFSLGKKIGDFGFSVRKKKRNTKKR